MENLSRINVAIDLTPLRPGGENGGAKTLVLTLLNAFTTVDAQKFHYLLITESWNHEELLGLQRPNMTCMLCSDIYNSSSIQTSAEIQNSFGQETIPLEEPSQPRFVFVKKTANRLIKDGAKSVVSWVKSTLGSQNKVAVKTKTALKRSRFYRALKSKEVVISLPDAKPQQIKTSPVLQERYSIDLLFCPFSSPQLAEDGLPLVAIAYDLQHLDMPFFFAAEESSHRTQFLSNLVARASQIICISDFTRQSLLKHFPARDEQLIAIPICIHERLIPAHREDTRNTLKKLGVDEDNYLFFPANFWPHKNHKMLLAAYSIYCHAHPDDALHLVFTGALEVPQVELRDMTYHLGCEANVHFLGFLKEDELIALWQGCKGLIFPSLYEGFGIPVLEAMWFDKPVACSAIGSLPEVGGDAVLYFDPRKPEAIAKAMAQVAHDEHLVADLVRRSQQHIKGFSQEAMAEQYLAVFGDVVSASKSPDSTI